MHLLSCLFAKVVCDVIVVGRCVADMQGQSWSMNSSDCSKWNRGMSQVYGSVPVATGEVVGVFLDFSTSQLKYSVNGRELGVAFSDLPNGTTLFPTFSLETQAVVRVNFGRFPFELRAFYFVSLFLRRVSFLTIFPQILDERGVLAD